MRMWKPKIKKGNSTLCLCCTEIFLLRLHPRPKSQVAAHPCPESLPLFPELRSQITHQSHFLLLAQTADQSDGRTGRNMIMDWLAEGKGVEPLSHPLTTAACCEMSERGSETERIHSSNFTLSSILFLLLLLLLLLASVPVSFCLPLHLQLRLKNSAFPI